MFVAGRIARSSVVIAMADDYAEQSHRRVDASWKPGGQVRTLAAYVLVSVSWALVGGGLIGIDVLDSSAVPAVAASGTLVVSLVLVWCAVTYVEVDVDAQ